jgi:hypothetical protein
MSEGAQCSPPLESPDIRGFPYLDAQRGERPERLAAPANVSENSAAGCAEMSGDTL